MHHWLKDRFIRNLLIFIFFLGFTLIPSFTYALPLKKENSILPKVLSMLSNEKREAQKLPYLKINPQLNKAANLKAKDMATKGYFAHTSPEGKTPWYWLKKAGYKYQYAGENLAINFTDSKDVTEAWMESPTHRANIIKNNYSEIGTGTAIGMYEGKETIFVVQVYANPLPAISSPDKNIKTLSKLIKK